MLAPCRRRTRPQSRACRPGGLRATPRSGEYSMPCGAAGLRAGVVGLEATARGQPDRVLVADRGPRGRGSSMTVTKMPRPLLEAIALVQERACPGGPSRGSAIGTRRSRCMSQSMTRGRPETLRAQLVEDLFGRARTRSPGCPTRLAISLTIHQSGLGLALRLGTALRRRWMRRSVFVAVCLRPRPTSWPRAARRRRARRSRS